MEAIIRNKDYVPQGDGGIRIAEGTQELLCQALFRLCCRRGSFPFLPELGSRLWQLRGRTDAQLLPLATAYCAEALEPMGLAVQEVTIRDRSDAGLRLDVLLTLRGEEEHVEVTL